MMKEDNSLNKKGWFISASILGMVVAGSTGVYAGSNLPAIKAFLNNKIGIAVNQVDFQPVDDKGKELYPITYNNTTYLPVRAVSDALNVPIRYDQANNKIWIGSAGSGEPSTSTPAFQRPQHLPSDFPLPADTKKIELVESASGNTKSVYFTLQTRESLKHWIETYTAYLQQRGYDAIADSSSDTVIELVSSSDTESVLIEGKIIDQKNNILQYSITWSTR